MDLIEHLVSNGNIARLSPLVHNGINLAALPRGVRLYRGRVFIEDLVSLDQVRADLYNAKATCCSAAVHYGLPLLVEDRDEATHLAVPKNRPIRRSRNRRLDDVRIHRETRPIDEDAARPWLASIESALERACQCVSLRSAVAMLDSARFQGPCDIGELRIPTRGPSTASISEAIARSRPNARSILETFARMELEDVGIPSQVGVVIPEVGEVDLVVFDRIVIELDGWEFHSSRAQRSKDIERDRRLAARGYLVVRFDFDAVMNSGRFVADVLALRDRVREGGRFGR